jgi:pimeloyl-ACP methyl ester carboxylesterase
LNLLNYTLKKGKSSEVTVVFIHGFLESKSMWNNFSFENFSFDSILVDLPGHGLSPNEDEQEPSIDYFSSMLKELIEDLKLTKVSIVGHSMGGYVALNFKHAYPDICNKIILLNSNFWTDSELKKRDRLRVVDIVNKNKSIFINEAIPNLFVNKDLHEHEIQELIKEANGLDAVNISYASLAMRNRKDYKNLLEVYFNDIYILQGEKDSIVLKSEMKERLLSLNVKFDVIKGTGHMSHIEQKNIVEKLISNFI